MKNSAEIFVYIKNYLYLCTRKSTPKGSVSQERVGLLSASTPIVRHNIAFIDALRLSKSKLRKFHLSVQDQRQSIDAYGYDFITSLVCMDVHPCFSCLSYQRRFLFVYL